MFYNNGKKVIPLNIYDYLTPLALTVWIMDNGGWANYGIKIATNCFELKEVELLNETIKSKYNLETTVRSTVQDCHFAVPSLGVKIDALPGRLNAVSAEPMVINHQIAGTS
ncbi:Cytochrome b mRNA maturase bI2 [Smittium culicis]|uniref:Cytochrome b mRNA maturase bI2 n=1 Tax=Smittium culicis TaxID=133412 RepID=A0A1R1WXL2_9FUNG|nr:Cytochrome b mRNA maturase bI2 [Smittium culicis]